MKPDTKFLRRIEALPAPRDFSALPDWLASSEVDHLIETGYLAAERINRNPAGQITGLTNLAVTCQGHQLVAQELTWPNALVKGSLAGACLTAMSMVILYVA